MNPLYSLPTMEQDLSRVECELERALPTHGENLLSQISTYLSRSKGKRLRASMVLLAAHLAQVGDWNDVYRAAASVELTHLATLVHDDLIDHAAVRRGEPAVHVRWTPAIAILMGDYLFARAISLMNLLGSPRASHHLTTTITQMCQGEISQQEQAFMLDLTEAQYITRIRQKTASFFASACAIGACFAAGQEELAAMLYQFGDALGVAYQVLDDLLDLTAPFEALGKPVGNDLLRGTLTLPVIYGLRHERWGKRLAKLIMDQDIDLPQVNHILTDCGAYTYTLEFVTTKIHQAEGILAAIPDHPARNCLSSLGQMILAKHTQHLQPIQQENPVASGSGV